MILIVKFGALGDVLRTTSLLGPLRRRYKEKISWLTHPLARPLLEGHPDIQEIVTNPKKLPQHFNLVLSLEENKKAAVWAQKATRESLIGVILKNTRLSYSEDSALYYDMSLLNQNRNQADALKAANQKTYADLWLEILDLPKPKNREEIRPKIFLNSFDRKAAQKIAVAHHLKFGHAIGFNPGSGKRWPSKSLSIPQSRQIIDALTRFNRPIILLGGKEEENRNKKIATGFKNVIRSKSLPVRAFAGVIDLCGVVVTTDTLAFHLSTALAKNSIVLIGPTSDSELDVYGRGEKIISKKACHCFYQKDCSQKISCLNQISPFKIAKTVERFL